MATPALPVTSPDISILSYSILFDISGASPNITLTNASTVTNASQLIWWYVITTPSGTPIHTGSLSSPDVANAAWTTLSILPNSPWPLMFGNPPCAQIEFSTSAPYVCTLYVRDSAGNTFSLPISQTIVRPNGNTANSCGNFGVAAVGVEVKCASNPAVVYCSDSTNYTYNNIVSPVTGSMSNLWTLVYPPDANGNQPANATGANTPYVNFPVGYNGSGYVIYLNDYATYDMGNGATIKVQYKAVSPDNGSQGIPFSVLCNVDLCRLQCQMQAFYALSTKTCNTVANSEYEAKKINISYLFQQAIVGIMQPLCNINVGEIVRQIQVILGNVGTNTGCGCQDSGINFNYPTSGSSSTSGCCPVSTNVLNAATGLAPSACPQSYFPVEVKDPTNSTVVGSANNINDLVAILNSTPAWQAYGIAFAEGNCKVGWFPTNPATTPPPVYVNLGATILPPSGYVVDIIDIDTDNPPAGCPTGSPYPVKVYNPAADLVIGIVNSIAELVSLLNATAAWAIYGTASVQDTCHVQFNLLDPSFTPPSIKVDTDTSGTGCTSNHQNYLVYMVDPCFPQAPVTDASFPCNVLVDWGYGSTIQVGLADSWAELITLLNAAAGKPDSVTFSLGLIPNSLEVTNTDCTAYPYSPVITCNAGSNDYLLFGANFTDQINTTPIRNGLVGLGLATNLDYGRVGGFDEAKHMWQTIYVGGYAIVAEGDTGKIYFYNMANPLNPSLARTIQLNDTGSGDCFTGLPNSTNYQSPTVAKPSYFSLYFPTDFYAGMSLNSIPVFEGTTGSIWVIDLFGSGSGIKFSDTDVRLLGKCPRILVGSSVVQFSQDGDLEQAAGLASTIPIGWIITLTFDSSSIVGIAQIQIFTQPEYVWAASYDGTQYVYWTGQYGSVGVAPYFSNPTVINSRIFGSSAEFKFRLNTSCFGGMLFFAAEKLVSGSPAVQLSMQKATTASLLAGIPVITSISLLATIFNIIPIGQCLMAITTSGTSVLIYKTNGTQVTSISITQATGYTAAIYNIIAIPGYSTYTPNAFINP